MVMPLVPGQRISISLEFTPDNDDCRDRSIASLESLGFDVEISDAQTTAGSHSYHLAAQQRPHTAIDPDEISVRICRIFQGLRNSTVLIEPPQAWLDENNRIPPDWRSSEGISGTGLLVDTKKQALDWCKANGYTNPFLQDGRWWAFPPNGTMPVSI